MWPLDIFGIHKSLLTGNQLEEKIEDAFYGQVSDHCVVVLAVEDDTVTLYDPAFGYTPLPVSKNHFLDAWEDSKRYYVKIFTNFMRL